MTGPVLMCPFCGADSPRKCDFDDGTDGEFEDFDPTCPWNESGQYDRDRELYEEERENDDDDAYG